MDALFPYVLHFVSGVSAGICGMMGEEDVQIWK